MLQQLLASGFFVGSKAKMSKFEILPFKFAIIISFVHSCLAGVGFETLCF